MGIAAAPALAIGGIQTGLSLFGASSRNSSIRAAMARANAAADSEIAQQGRIAKQQTERARRDEARVKAIINVTAAERGVGESGSVEALIRNAAIQGEDNVDAIRLNRYGAEQSTLAQLQGVQDALEAQGSNLFLSGLSGAIQGASTGLSIGRGLSETFPETFGKAKP